MQRSGCHICACQTEAGNAKRDDDWLLQAGDVSGELRAEKQCRAAEDRQSQPDRKAAEQDQLRNLVGGQTPAGIEAIANGAAAQRREADVVTERQASEGGECSQPVGQGVTHVTQRQPIEAGQAEIACPGKQPCHAQSLGRNRSYRRDNLIKAVTA